MEAGIASPGTADSFLTASSITRTRQMYHITVLVQLEIGGIMHPREIYF